MRYGGERELLGLLHELDARLGAEAEGERLTLYVFGGAAAVIAYGARRATADIDAWLEDERLNAKLIEWAGRGTALALKHGIYFQRAHIHMMPIEEPEWKERSVEILKGRLKRIRVMVLGKADFVLSKLGRYNDRDREDINHIIRTQQVDVKTLISYYKAARRFYVGRLETLDQTFNIVLEENFGHKPIRFEC